MIPFVRVLGKDYAVQLVPADGEDDGQCHHSQCRIDVNESLCHSQMADTLLHEITHAVDYEMHCGLREAQVRRMATGILAVLRDNPALVAYLTA